MIDIIAWVTINPIKDGPFGGSPSLLHGQIIILHEIWYAYSIPCKEQKFVIMTYFMT